MKLVVIGNGFDLHHKLPTSFNQYLNFTKLDNLLLSIFKQKSNIDSITWIDFEVEISNILLFIGELSTFLSFDDYSSNFYIDQNKIKEPNFLFLLNVFIEYYDDELFYYINGRFEILQEKVISWIDIIKSDLLEAYNAFIDDFNDYIYSVEQSFDDDFPLSVNQYMIDFIRDASEIINFNYTNSVEKYLNYRVMSRNNNRFNAEEIVKHVHNKVNNNIIIGIAEMNNHFSEYNSKYFKTVQYISKSKVKTLEIETYISTMDYAFDRFRPLEVTIIGHSFGVSDFYVFNFILDVVEKHPESIGYINFNYFVYDEMSKMTFIYNLKKFLGSSVVDKMNRREQINFFNY